MTLPDALDAPRFFPTAEPGPGVRWSVQDLSDGYWDLNALAVFGIAVGVDPDALGFGQVNGIAYDHDSGHWLGVADPEGSGAAQVPRTVPDARIQTAESGADRSILPTRGGAPASHPGALTP